MQEVLLKGKTWGCVAGQVEATGLFKYPLTLTAVHPFSEAACAGLRPGDQVVSWHPGPGPWISQNARTVVGVECLEGQNKGRVVDDETQKCLLGGGAIRMRVKLVPRCARLSYPPCQGTIVESEDSFDHSLVCDECGMIQRGSLVFMGAEWRTFEKVEACRVGMAVARPFAEQGSPESALQETVMAGVCGGAFGKNKHIGARKPGSGKENAGARRELRLEQQQRQAVEDIGRYCDALSLSKVTSDEAAALFAEVAKANGGKRFKNGGQICDLVPTLIASIHCASLLASSACTIHEILAVVDEGAGATLRKANEAVKKVREANRGRCIPILNAEALLPRMCGVHMRLGVDVEEQCRDTVRYIQGLNMGCQPATVAAVAILWQLSATAPGEYDCWRAKASEASGISEATLHTTLSKARRAALPAMPVPPLSG